MRRPRRGPRYGRTHTHGLARLVSLAAGAAVVLSMSVVAVASAEPHAPTKGATARAAHYVPAHGTAGSMRTMSASSGGRSGDWTGDGIPDMLVRDRDTGQLMVIPHAGTFDGHNTYGEPVVINNGWGNARWVGQADLGGDGLADALALLPNGELWVYPHSGTFDGLNTLSLPTLIGYNFDVHDLLFTGDVNGDGFDDLLARRAGTGNTFFYPNNGGVNGRQTFAAADLLAAGGQEDQEQNFADVTLDGIPDLVYVSPKGTLGAFDLANNESFDISDGWQTRTALTLTEINGDGHVDFLGRRASDDGLEVFVHSAAFDPANPGATLGAPIDVGVEAGNYDVIS